MGYTTSFWGEFNVSPPLKPEHAAYLKEFARVRHMRRDARLTASLPDPIREAVKLPVGPQGEFYVGGDETSGVTDYNEPGDQPGLWCQWMPGGDGTSDDNNVIAWDGGEKFYDYVEWIDYLVETFIKPWGYELDGTVEWEGEDSGDLGKIDITRNVVNVKRGHVVYE